MSRRSTAIATGALAALLFTTLGCAKKVQVPPRVDLGAWRTIGIVEFAGDADPALGSQATRRFVQALQHAQPGVRVLELGPEARVLREVKSEELDFDAVRAVGERYRVDAVFVGHLELSRPKPRVSFGEAFTSMEARADVRGELASRLLETESGATVWSRTATSSANVAHLGVAGVGTPSFGATDPSDAYAGLVRQLVVNLTPDFYPRWQKQ